MNDEQSPLPEAHAGRVEIREHNEEALVLSVEEYRKLLNDYATSDARIKERIGFVTRFVRNIISSELDRYV